MSCELHKHCGPFLCDDGGTRIKKRVDELLAVLYEFIMLKDSAEHVTQARANAKGFAMVDVVRQMKEAHTKYDPKIKSWFRAADKPRLPEDWLREAIHLQPKEWDGPKHAQEVLVKAEEELSGREELEREADEVIGEAMSKVEELIKKNEP